MTSPRDGYDVADERSPRHSIRERPRTLIVRGGPGMGELAQTLRRDAAPCGHAVDEVDDVFDALAALGASGTVGAVAVPLRAAGDEPRLVREAFRRVDPAVRLVLLAPRGASAVADDAGFDDVVFLPAGSRDIASALRLPGLQAEAESAEESRASAAQPLAEREPPAVATERRAPTPAARANEPVRRDVVDLVIDDALQAFAARRNKPEPEPGLAPQLPTEFTPAPSPVELESIGDTDLVDAVIAGGDRLAPTALTIIRRELHTDDVHILAEEEWEREPQIHAAVPIRWRDRTLGMLVSTHATAEALTPWASWLAHWLRLSQMQDELRLFAWTDDLTGAGNRRAFERVLEETIAEARTSRRPVSLMYFDIDDFKSYNDRFGHDAGDEVLRETLQLLRAVIRRGDHVFRVGGDEFVVIFADSRGTRSGDGAPLESIETITMRFRDRVRDLKFPQLGLDAPGTLSISAGVAMYPWDGHDARSLLRHADELSMQSKRSGKNMITFGPGAKDHCRKT